MKIIFLNAILLANCFLVFFLWEDEDLYENVIFHKDLNELNIIFGVFAFVYLTRVIKGLYIYKVWGDIDQNPTIKEAKVEYYSQFTIGLLDTILQIVSIHFVRKNNIITRLI